MTIEEIKAKHPKLYEFIKREKSAFGGGVVRMK